MCSVHETLPNGVGVLQPLTRLLSQPIDHQATPPIFVWYGLRSFCFSNLFKFDNLEKKSRFDDGWF